MATNETYSGPDVSIDQSRPLRATVPAVATYFSRSEFLGVRVDDVAVDQLLAQMRGSMLRGDRLLVLHVNAWLLTLARSRVWMREMFRNADVVFVDGTGAQWAGRLLTGKTLTRSTPPEWIDSLGRMMAQQNSSVFWLGSHDIVIRTAAAKFSQSTGVRTAGWHHGYFSKSPTSADNRKVVQLINTSGADLLIVNMGMPLQEQWLHENWGSLQVKVALTAGALAERVSGFAPIRPPAWVSACGLEWLTRLIAEPKRLWRRYLIGLPMFGILILFETLQRTLSRLHLKRPIE